MSGIIWIKHGRKVVSVELRNVLFIKGDKYGCTLYVKLIKEDAFLINKIRTLLIFR
ncbi:hypothetical protein SAMN05216323_10781 [Williamwhitmania taraxaci]|uniref:Uncharacterized protein n=1 Tax=Williamwhitmania taraxaci TaxID=1640674 RepID=A0A1G6RQL7_9BACT|nr:hypothetical protein SAMN05216323_10781 [Williamwhitmania taraxaci]